MSEESESNYTGPKFKVGDVVQLKSGGPMMTVIVETDEDGDVECRWFRDEGIVDDAYFSGYCVTPK